MSGRLSVKELLLADLFPSAHGCLYTAADILGITTDVESVTFQGAFDVSPCGQVLWRML